MKPSVVADRRNFHCLGFPPRPETPLTHHLLLMGRSETRPASPSLLQPGRQGSRTALRLRAGHAFAPPAGLGAAREVTTLLSPGARVLVGGNCRPGVRMRQREASRPPPGGRGGPGGRPAAEGAPGCLFFSCVSRPVKATARKGRCGFYSLNFSLKFHCHYSQ